VLFSKNKNLSELIIYIILFLLPFYDLTFSGIKLFEIFFVILIVVDVFQGVKVFDFKFLIFFMLLFGALIRSFIILYFNFQQWNVSLVLYKVYEYPYIWNTFVFIQLIVIFYLLKRAKSVNFDINYINKIYLLILIIELSLSLYQILFLKNQFPSGTMTEKGPLGTYAVGITFFYDLLYSDKLCSKSDYMKISILSFFLLALTISGRGYILYLIWKFSLLFFSSRIKSLFKKIAGLSALIIIFYYFSNYIFFKIQTYSAFLTNSSLVSRAIGRYAAPIIVSRVLKTNPLFGLGFSNYSFIKSSEKYGFLMIQIGRDYSNNIFMSLIVDSGIVGMILIILFTFLYFKRDFLSMNKNNFWPVMIFLFFNANVAVINDYIFWSLILYIMIYISLKKHKIAPNVRGSNEINTREK